MRALPVVVILLMAAGVVQGSHGGPHPSTLELAAPDMQVGVGASLAASLRHPNGDPEPRAKIVFELGTAFGWLELGQRFTNADGEAILEYTPTGPGTFAFRARFNGTSTLDASEAIASTSVADVPLQTVVPTATFVMIVVAIVVGGIWGTYGFVLLGLRRIWIEGGGSPRLRGRRGTKSR